MEYILSKEKFVKYIKDIQTVVEYESGLYDFLTKHKVGGYIFQPNCIDTVIDLLNTIFGESDNDGWINYFVWELNFGKEYKDGMVLNSESKPIRLDTAERLYDFLCEMSCDK